MFSEHYKLKKAIIARANKNRAKLYAYDQQMIERMNEYDGQFPVWGYFVIAMVVAIIFNLINDLV